MHLYNSFYTSFINTKVACLSVFCLLLPNNISFHNHKLEQQTTSKLLEVKCREASTKPGTHFFPNILLPRFSENPSKRMHFNLQFKTRLNHVSLKMESIILLRAQICVLQCLQNMQSLGSFPAQTSMPLFGSLLCARFRAQETAESADPLSPMESPAGLYPKIKHPAASYQGASSQTCRQHLPDCLSPFLVFCFSCHLGEFLEQLWWYRTRHSSESIPLESSLTDT